MNDLKGVFGMIQLHASFEKDGKFCMVMEKGSTKDMRDLRPQLAELARASRGKCTAAYDQDLPFRTDPQHRPTEFKRIMYYMLSGAAEMHRRGVIHRDLKPESYVFRNNNPRLIDFGFATRAPSKKDEDCGTEGYMAPEVLKDNIWTKASDVWAFGVTMYELSTDKYLFYTKVLSTGERNYSKTATQFIERPTAAADRLREKCTQFGKVFGEQGTKPYKNAARLLRKLLEPDAGKRITAKDALKRPFFDEVRPKHGFEVGDTVTVTGRKGNAFATIVGLQTDESTCMIQLYGSAKNYQTSLLEKTEASLILYRRKLEEFYRRHKSPMAGKARMLDKLVLKFTEEEMNAKLRDHGEYNGEDLMTI